MEDLMAFGGLLAALFLLLMVSLLVAARLYIHSFQKWMEGSQRELRTIREELKATQQALRGSFQQLEGIDELESI